MTVIEISKKQIIKAIKEEPLLQAGRWILPPISSDYDDVVIGDKCKVCAVGAVMRRVLDNNQNYLKLEKALGPIGEHSIAFGVRGDTEIFLRKKMYLAALSNFFELTWHAADARSRLHYELSRHQIYRVRQKTIKFVEENFPAKIQIDIDGVLPSKNVKIIKQ